MTKRGRRGALKVFLDSNLLIAYLFMEKERFTAAKDIIERHEKDKLGTSIIALHEIHYFALKLQVEERFWEASEKLKLAFRVEPLTEEVCLKASRLRVKHKLPEVDALIAATAAVNGYNAFYTFDQDFKSLHQENIEKTKILWVQG